MAGTVEMGAPGNRFGLSGTVHRNLRFQLDLERIQRKRCVLGLVEPAIDTIDCGYSTNRYSIHQSQSNAESTQHEID